jgi:hypothetical protein
MMVKAREITIKTPVEDNKAQNQVLQPIVFVCNRILDD